MSLLLALTGSTGSTITGTLAATEAQDAAALDGALGHVGTLDATEAQDSASIAGSVGDVVPTVGLSTPVRKRRKRIFKKDIYGCVISGFEEVFNRKPTHSVVSEITDQVANTLESESDDTAAWLEVQSRIMQILVEMEAQEDEETSLFAML